MILQETSEQIGSERVSVGKVADRAHA